MIPAELQQESTVTDWADMSSTDQLAMNSGANATSGLQMSIFHPAICKLKLNGLRNGHIATVQEYERHREELSVYLHANIIQIFTNKSLQN